MTDAESREDDPGDSGPSSEPNVDPRSREAVDRRWREREAKWQAHWRENPVPRGPQPPPAPAPEPPAADSEAGSKSESSRDRRRRERKARRKSFYCLDMFPYPSLTGFSVNQLRGVAITDVVARYQQARGRDVLRPIGWDCFGLSLEAEAEREGISPQEVVDRGVSKMRGQLVEFGARVDWDRELRTTDPSFYKWTQWLFGQMLERDIAYRETVSTKWCAQCGMNLANEEVADGRCVHCGSTVEEGREPQWKLRITEYADRLHLGLRQLKWPQRVRSMQRHWIGRLEGHAVTVKVGGEFSYEFGECPVFVRQLELLPAATYLVLAPEHPLVDRFCDELYRDDVFDYRRRVVRLNERERLAASGAPEGHPTGAFALNPVTLQPMPIWVSKMVLPEVRFGAILGMPGHNDRHAEFASRFNLPSRVVLTKRESSKKDRRGRDSAGELVMINAGPLSGTPAAEARRRIKTRLEARGAVEPHTTYNLRDWIFARQRFWGEPIPIVHCEECGAVPVPESDLPVEVPLLDAIPRTKSLGEAEVEVEAEVPESVEVEETVPASAVGEPAGGDLWDFFSEESAVVTPNATESEPRSVAPLATLPEFVETQCPKCGQEARRETDTMPQWAASCWYYLRYLDPENPDAIFDPARGREWLPVDLCVGGIEHAILHLLYVRFFAYFAHDLGLTTREEPFRRLFNQGRIYRKAPSSTQRKVPTHRGDRIAAESYLEQYGGDALRLHLLFLGPPASDVVWSKRGLRGTRRFLERAYEVVLDRKESGRFVSRKVLVEKHRLIRRVTTAIRTFKLNKAVSAFMAFIKTISSPPLTPEEVDLDTLKTFTILLAPFAPHLAAELWERLDGGDVNAQPWPEYSEELLRPVEPELALQVNNRVRDRMRVEGEPPKSELIQAALQRDRIRDILGDRSPDRVIVVPGRLINFVVADLATE